MVEKVGRDIFNAQEGEKIALSEPMQLVILPCEGEKEISITLDIAMSDNPDINECIHGYCLLRFIWLAYTMGAVKRYLI